MKRIVLLLTMLLWAAAAGGQTTRDTLTVTEVHYGDWREEGNFVKRVISVWGHTTTVDYFLSCEELTWIGDRPSAQIEHVSCASVDSDTSYSVKIGSDRIAVDTEARETEHDKISAYSIRESKKTKKVDR
jgi:hypothetical protein